MKTRLIIVAGIIVIWIIAAVMLSQFGPQRQAEELSATLRTANPTFTATATPTETLTPSPTPTPTSTLTPTPTATNTPLPTDTPLPTPTPTDTATPSPTDTPTPAPTSTPRPTSPPAKTATPAPTSTPTLPFAGEIVGGSPNCGTMGVWGYVWDKSGSPYPGVMVGVWTDSWAGGVSGPANAEGKYTVVLGEVPPGEFIVAVVDPNSCETHDGVLTADHCNHLSDPIRVTVFEIYECEKEGTVQWSEVHFSAQ